MKEIVRDYEFDSTVKQTIMLDKDTLKLVKMVDNAVGKKEYRTFMTHMYYNCEDMLLIGTDGRRMHMLDTSNNGNFIPVKQSGYADIVGTSLVIYVEQRFDTIHYKRVIPKTKIITDKSYDFTDRKKFNVYVGEFYNDIHKNVNLGFLQDLIGLEYNLGIQTDDNNYPNRERAFTLTGNNGRFTGILMPLVEN